MVKLTEPLLSQSAAGTIGDAIVYREGKSGAHAYALLNVRRANRRPPTAAQAAVRASYSAAAEAWRQLPATDRETWQAEAEASGRPIHGWALYLERWGGDEPNPPPPVPMPDGLDIHVKFRGGDCIRPNGITIEVRFDPCRL